MIITVNRLNDGRNILGGIITKSDLLDAYVKSYGGNVAVNEYMTKKVLTVRPDEPVHMVLLIIVDNNLSRVIVVQGDGKPIGIITNHDVLPASTLLLANKTTPYTQYWIKRKDIENNNKGIISRSKGNLPYGMKRILLAEDIMKINADYHHRLC